jgi:feruloyl esterase
MYKFEPRDDIFSGLSGLRGVLGRAGRDGRPRGDRRRLDETTGFDTNPGALRMFSYVPRSAPRSPALVVVLHGCTQTAEGYDTGAGWSTLADRHGFLLLLPEQTTDNNPNRCFNWFQEEDAERDRGEALSIRQMIARMAEEHAIDPARVFVTGLSAGGAMANVMLATYPEVFAGGAIVAGVPYGCASSVPEAFACMAQGGVRSARAWGDLVRAASPHRGPWPKVAIWQGTADTTVRPQNATELVKQWTNVHGLASAPTFEDTVAGYPHHVWTDAAGRELVEEFLISGMAHGTPLATTGEDAAGVAGAFLLEAGISSSDHIARFWGLAGDPPQPTPAPDPAAAAPRRTRAKPDEHRARTDGFDLRGIIDRALRAAGLMN